MISIVSELVPAVIANSLVALVLAVAAMLIGRFTTWHRVAHLMWLCVLAKLCTPALIELPVTNEGLSRMVRRTGHESAVAEAVVVDARPVSSQEHVGETPYTTERPILVVTSRETFVPPIFYFLGLWAAGSLFAFAWIIRKHVVFMRRLELSQPCKQILREVRLSAENVGWRSPPRIMLSRKNVSPFVVASAKGALLVLPGWLLDRFSMEQRQPLIVHELAHLRRGDHLIRLFVCTMIVLHWWNPLVWLACSRLRQFEELCCDDLVSEILPEQKAVYANALLDVVTVRSRSRTGLPFLASGADSARNLRCRIEAIFRDKPTRRWSRQSQLLGISLAALVLLTGPRLMGLRSLSDVAQPHITYGKPLIRYSLDE